MRRFEPKDLDAINAWLSARALPAAGVDDLGQIGYIVEGVAAGFLLRTDARRVAMLDCFVTNPAAPLRKRYDAVWMLIGRLCAEAHARGIQRLGGFTKSRGMTKLCERLGWTMGDLLVTLRKEM
jgi:hypothetical protein